MKIVLAVDGTRGDVHPMLALAERLQAAGHEPVLCAPPDFRDVAVERGVAFHPVGWAVRAFLTSRARAFVAGNLATLGAMRSTTSEIIAEQFDQLTEAAQGADRLIGAGVQFAASSVAEAMGIPYRYIAYCPVVFPSAEHPPFTIQSQDLPRWLNRLAWWMMRPLSSLLLGPEIDRHRARLGLGPVEDAYAQLVSPRPILAADPALAGCPTEHRAWVHQIPCLHPHQSEALPEKIESFLRQGEAPVFLGFGSMPDPNPGRTTREILSAVTSLGCRALISEGWAGLGDVPLPEGVLAIPPVSHAALFPRVSVVIHHGGAGTTTTAARSGVPQILIPHILDQFYWARRTRDLGIAPLSIPRKRFTAEKLRTALAEILGNELVAERAGRLGTRLLSDLAAGCEGERLVE